MNCTNSCNEREIDMPAALPIISGGLGIYSAIKGAQQQGRARRAEEEQLKQQGIARTMLMGRLGALGRGAQGNPFAGAYGPMAAPAPVPSGLPPGVAPGIGVNPLAPRPPQAPRLY